MSEPSVSLTTELRSSLAPVLAASGLTLRERADFAGLFAQGVSHRSVQVVGDHLAETLRVDPDGRVFYMSGWYACMSYQGLPADEVLMGLGRGALPTPPVHRTEAVPDNFRITATPAGDPMGRYSLLTIESQLSEPDAFGRTLELMRAIARHYNPLPDAEPSIRSQAAYFLMEPGVIATFREWLDGEYAGYGTFEVLSGTHTPEEERATVEQADCRGDRYRYEVLRNPEGVATEIKGGKCTLVQDWIWRYPIEAREWTETLEGSENLETKVVSMRLYPAEGPVDIEAGRFWGCLKLSLSNENGSSTHTYHPLAGLILSEFVDVDGVPGRRELMDLEVRS